MTNYSIPKAQPSGKRRQGSLLPEEQKQLVTKLHEGKVNFSFFHLDTNHEAFNCGGTETSWFLHLFDNLKEISKLSRHEFVVQQRQHYDVHPHDWNKTAFVFDLPQGMLEQLGEDKCIQFRLSTSGGRVHGFMIDNTFYVVWLDPHHNMYPDQRYGGLKFFAKPLTPYEQLLHQFKTLEEEYKELQAMLNELTSPGAAS